MSKYTEHVKKFLLSGKKFASQKQAMSEAAKAWREITGKAKGPKPSKKK